IAFIARQAHLEDGAEAEISRIDNTEAETIARTVEALRRTRRADVESRHGRTRVSAAAVEFRNGAPFGADGDVQSCSRQGGNKDGADCGGTGCGGGGCKSAADATVTIVVIAEMATRPAETIRIKPPHTLPQRQGHCLQSAIETQRCNVLHQIKVQAES